MMLAKVPPLHLKNLTFPPHPCQQQQQQQQLLHRHRHHFHVVGGGGIIERRKRMLSVVRAGYTRKPTGTAGAYQLIDEETGEKFFVWGGLDNDPSHDSSIPSKHVLSWRPPSSDDRDAQHNQKNRGTSLLNLDLDWIADKP